MNSPFFIARQKHYVEGYGVLQKGMLQNLLQKSKLLMER